MGEGLPFFEGLVRDAAEWLRARERFALCTHVHPDADGVGSQAALCRALLALGKDAILFNPTPVPRHLRFLTKGLETFWARTEDECAAALHERHPVLFDIGNFDRMGLISQQLDRPGADVLLIDHHPATLKPPADAARAICPLTHADVSSTGELTFRLIEALGITLTPSMASALFAAIATDTGFFKHSNASASTFSVTAKLVEAGAKPDTVFKELYERNTYARVVLGGKVIATMQVGEFGKVAWVEVTRAMLRDSHATMEDTSEIVNYTLRVSGVEVGMLFKEVDAAHTRVSIRSKGHLSAHEIARLWGGGGHPKAAGAMLALPLDEAKSLVVHTVQDLLGLMGKQQAAGG